MSRNENMNEPGCESQNGRILHYLREGETITSLEALVIFKCLRCASRISDLRNETHQTISDVTIEVKSKDEKTGKTTTKRVSAYYLAEAFAKKRGIMADKSLEDQVKMYATKKAQHAFNDYYGE